MEGLGLETSFLSSLEVGREARTADEVRSRLGDSPALTKALSPASRVHAYSDLINPKLIPAGLRSFGGMSNPILDEAVKAKSKVKKKPKKEAKKKKAA